MGHQFATSIYKSFNHIGFNHAAATLWMLTSIEIKRYINNKCDIIWSKLLIWNFGNIYYRKILKYTCGAKYHILIDIGSF